VVRMNKKRDFRWVILIFIVVFILMLRFFVDSRLYGHDTFFHTGSIINLSKTISWNNLLGNNLVSFTSNQFGYGTWFFYPKLPHLLGSYVYLIFKDIYFSMGIVYFITTFLSGVMMYFLSKKLFSCPRVAFLSSLIYLTFSYHLCEIYTRDAYAENFMFFVVPMIFFGLYELKDGNYNRFYFLFTLGYVIGMYSHLVSMLFCTIFVFLFLLYYRKYFFCKSKIKSLLISTLIVIGMACPFIFSVLEYKIYEDYIVFSDFFSNKNTVLFNILPVNSYFIHDKEFNHNNILVYLNYSTIVLFGTTFILFLLKKNRRSFLETRKFLLRAMLGIILFISSTSFWEYLPKFLSMIQFSWRLTIFLGCIVSLYAPLVFYNIKKKKKIYYFIYSFLVVIMIGEGINNICYYGEKEYSSDEINESSAVMGWQFEYLPLSVINMSSWHYGDYLENREYKFLFSDSFVEVKVLNDKFPMIQFEVEDIDKSFEIEIPRIYYRGYELCDQDGNIIPIYQTESGFLGTELFKDGIYTLKYVGTIGVQICKIVRVITYLVIFIFGGRVLWNKRKLQF